MRPRVRFRRARRMLLLSAAMLAVLSAGVTTITSSTASQRGSKKFTIGLSEAILSNPVIAAHAAGVKTQAAKYGMEVVVTDAQFNAGKQISDIDSLIARGVDAILLIPVNNQAIEPALKRARDKGIIVIARDGEPREPWTSTFNGNHFDSGSAGAFWLAKRLGRGAKVAQILGNPSTGLLRARNEGFEDGAKKAGLEIVEQQINFRDTADGARPIADAWRAKHGSQLKAIWAYNDPSAIGAASAAGGSFDPVITGYNGSPEGVQAIRDNKIAATWDIQAPEQGQAMAYVAHQILTGKKGCPRLVNVSFKRFDKQNVGEWLEFDKRTGNPLPVAIVQKGGNAIMLVGKSATQYRAKLKKRKLKVRC